MSKMHIQSLKVAALASGLVGLAGAAGAQGLVQTAGTIVATDGDAVPDSTGAPIPNFTFGGSSALGNNPVMEQAGKVLFQARFVDSMGPLPAYNDKAFFYGSSRADLKMVIRGEDQAPGLPAGVLLRTVTGSSIAMGSSPQISPDGRMFWGSTFLDSIPPNTNVTSGVNDNAIFGGFFGSQGLFVRKNDVAPGTGGANFAQAFNSPSQQSTGINSQGRIFFSGTLVNGTGVPAVTTTSGMNNQTGYFAGFPGALNLVVRKSDPVSGLGGAVAIDTSSSIGFLTQMNTAGEFLYEVTLSTTQGAPAATLTDDKAYMVWDPNTNTSTKLLRESDVAPGTGGGTFNAISGTSWSIGVSGNCWTRSGETIFASDLVGGTVTPGVDDRAIYKGGIGTLAIAVRKGDAAPGTDATFSNWNNNSLLLNDNGRICFQGILTGGTSTTANDTGVWTGIPGSLTLALREGDVLPGTGGSIAGGLSGTSIYFNDAGQVLFNVSLSGGTITGSSLWAWDPTLGLMPVVLPGDQIEIAPGVFRNVWGFGGVSFNNSDGAAMFFGHDGQIGIRLSVDDGGVPAVNSNVIVKVRLPVVTPSTTFCFGDGTGTACPCGNAGAAGNGCANSLNANGANLSGSGGASIGADTFVLSGIGMPNSSALYFQGTAQQSGGAGALFGDGLRCAAGTVTRLKTVTNVAGASQYPEVGDQPIHIRGSCSAGDTRHYQSWYRNAAAFCTAATFNLTNGVSVTWIP